MILFSQKCEEAVLVVCINATKAGKLLVAAFIGLLATTGRDASCLVFMNAVFIHFNLGIIKLKVHYPHQCPQYVPLIPAKVIFYSFEFYAVHSKRKNLTNTAKFVGCFAIILG